MKKAQTLTTTSTRKRVLLLVSAGALLVAVMDARHCAGLNVPYVDPIVSFERSQPDTSPAAPPASAAQDLLDDGEVYRTADRLREASALTLAAGIYIANESSSSRFVRSAEDVAAGIRSAGLLPPGVAPAPGAMLLSNRSRLLLRFRPEPLAVEVLSFPRTREDGPALMIRIPSLGNDLDRGSVFIADRLGDLDPPAPLRLWLIVFAPAGSTNGLTKKKYLLPNNSNCAPGSQRDAIGNRSEEEPECQYFTTSTDSTPSAVSHVRWMRLILPRITPRYAC